MNASYRRSATRFVLLATLLLTLAACDVARPVTPQVEKAAITAAGPQTIVVEYQNEAVDRAMPMLPAWETAAERVKGKLDESDDYRWAHKEWFAVTDPPEDGRFRPFAEWEEMEAVWTTYSGGMPYDAPVRRMFAEQTIAFLRHGTPKVKAYVIVGSPSVQNDFLKAVDEFGITPDEKKDIVMVGLPNQTIWHIDYSFFPIMDKKTGLMAFADYNYYPGRHIDDAIPTRIATDVYKHVTVYRMAFPFEGGNIQADGVGTCMTTQRALKNTGYTNLKVMNLLKKYAACDQTVVVKDITDDGTGHIDMFFKWAGVDQIVLGEYNDSLTLDYDGDGKEEEVALPGAVVEDYKGIFATNKQRMNDNEALFKAMTAANGEKFKVHRLTMMTRVRDSYGNLPRTFINSTLSNKVNVYPSYSTKSCQDPKGAKCMKDADCTGTQFCAAGKCTGFSYSAQGQLQRGTAFGCDELVACPTGQVCADDPLKVALVAKAQKQWEAAMPDWKHVGLRADTIAFWSGAIHCITRNVPVNKKEKVIPDAICLSGNCGCVKGGAEHACDGDGDCFGPRWRCGCNICKGTCSNTGKSGTSCTDDADCSTDGKTVPDGACVYDVKQGCYGKQEPGYGNACGDLAWEGACEGKTVKYCGSGSIPKSVSCSGGTCCGWSAPDKSYSCISSTQCAEKCVPECDKVGDKNCSMQGTHMWECVDEGGCLKRKWTHCSSGGKCVVSPEVKCTSPNDVAPQCPNVTDKDAGGAGADGGGTEADAGGQVGADGTTTGDSAIAADVAQDAGTATPAPQPADDGCTAQPASSSKAATGLMALLLAALSLVVWRRRQA